MLLVENRWKVFLLVLTSVAAAEPSRALQLYQKPYKNVMFVPKNSNYYRKRSRVLFLDESENHQPYGRGEIDLTDKNYSKIKFDETTDYEFTSPEENTEISKLEDSPSGNERFYEPLPRFRPFQNHPHYYQGRFTRPYAPNYAFEPFQTPYLPSPMRNGYYSGWKARSPRVVFPYASESLNSVHTNSHAGPGPGFNDNVVFREPAFSSNDVDEQNLQNLQDLGSGGGEPSDRGKLILFRFKNVLQCVNISHF